MRARPLPEGEVTLRKCWLVLITVLGLAFCPPYAAISDEDDDEDVVAAVEMRRFEFPESSFYRMVFRQFGNSENTRLFLERTSAMNVSDLDRACQLTEAQRKKIELAARGDIHRFFDQVANAHQRFLLVRFDEQKFNEFWRDVQPLQTELQTGIFGSQSLFRKTLKNTLTAQQVENFLREADERDRFRYRAKVELALAILEVALPLRDEQRHRLMTLILEETKPPRQYGRYDNQFVILQLSRIPESKLKPIFDETEWKVLNRQFEHVANFVQAMKQHGIVLDESDE